MKKCDLCKIAMAVLMTMNVGYRKWACPLCGTERDISKWAFVDKQFVHKNNITPALEKVISESEKELKQLEREKKEYLDRCDKKIQNLQKKIRHAQKMFVLERSKNGEKMMGRKTIAESLKEILKKHKGEAHIFDVERALFKNNVIGCGIEAIDIVREAEKEKWVKYDEKTNTVSLLTK